MRPPAYSAATCAFFAGLGRRRRSASVLATATAATASWTPTASQLVLKPRLSRPCRSHSGIGRSVKAHHRLLLQLLDRAADETQRHDEQERRCHQEHRAQRQQAGGFLHHVVDHAEADRSGDEPEHDPQAPPAALGRRRVKHHDGLAAFAEHRQERDEGERDRGAGVERTLGMAAQLAIHALGSCRRNSQPLM